MSGSEPGEMAPKSSRAVVVLKFDMHIYTSELTSMELKDAINEYCILIDLHPRLPHPGMTMNMLPLRYIDAMPWRHSDIDLYDDFLIHFNKDDVVRLSEFQKNLEKPNPKIAATREKKDQQSLTRAEAKRAGTVSNPATIASKVPPQFEKEVVDLSGNTRVSSPPVIDVAPSSRQEHHDTNERVNAPRSNEDRLKLMELMVFWLQKGKSYAAKGFEQVIDFLSRSYIYYALTVNPPIYISCIKQFWNTASVKRSANVTRLQALVDKKKIVISEVVIHKILQLNDVEGVVCLPNEEIFAGLAQMGYEKPSTKLTFYKAFFSSQ
nr:hypothetical protein [Tanacetum cinerariifolium]